MTEKNKVLIIDTNQLTRWFITAALEREGFEVIAFDRLEETRELISQGEIRIIIIDFDLIKGKEEEILGEMTQINPLARLILLTDEIPSPLPLELSLQEKTIFIERPFSLERLKKVITTL